MVPPLGHVRVDLDATRARWEASASSGAQYDMASKLYTRELTSRHRYVEISQRSTGVNTHAQLRVSVLQNGDQNYASAGFLAALGIEDEQGRKHAEEVALDVSQVDHRDAACECAMGDLAHVEVVMLDRTRPPRTILTGLSCSIPMLLKLEDLWDGKRVRVMWFNEPERVEFRVLAFKTHGTGCCANIGRTSSDTRVGLVFKNTVMHSTGLTRTPAFKTVDEYTSQVAKSMGGVASYSATLVRGILDRLDREPSTGRVRPNVGAILSGLPGIGKTALAKAVCDQLDIYVRYLNAADIFQSYAGHSETQMVKIFEELVHRAPSILVIDGLESATTSRANFVDSESPLEVGVLGTILSCLNRLKDSNARVFVLGITSRIDDIDAAIFSNGRLDLVIRMQTPTQPERHDILRILLNNWSIDSSDENIVHHLSERTGGFVGADLLSLCQRALQCCVNDPESPVNFNQPTLFRRHFDGALSITFPSVLQAHHVSLRQQKSKTIEDKSTEVQESPFTGFYGADAAVNAIKVSLIEPLRDCSRFLAFGTVPPKGILLTGPPGSGKTHLANIIATELRRSGLASFVSVRCTDLLTKVVGDTEKSLRELFDTARNATPCVIYFDQIESIAPVRGFDTSTEQTFDRLLSMLLVEMDGFNSSTDKIKQNVGTAEAQAAFLKQHVVILASTTRKTLLDPAILRPGRFDVHIELELPTEEARSHIILDELQRIPLDYTSDPALTTPELVALHVAKQTQGFTAGDVSALFREAAMAAMREDFTVCKVPLAFVTAAIHQRRLLKP